MNAIGKVAVAALTGGALLALGVSPASAEGSRTTYIGGWERGRESNRWYDSNTGTVETSVRLSGCYTDSSFNSATLSLYQDISWSPDKNVGNRTNYCGASYWGRPGAGSYYFKLADFSGGSRFTADPVYITW
ncbi:hypothetical protein [Streptomyces erythrochromogenes]|uniref:hypothetical protein n=1 Tax=Streptomyces erythrochromogenes TaxID=285574 RepID=UPI0038193CD5